MCKQIDVDVLMKKVDQIVANGGGEPIADLLCATTNSSDVSSVLELKDYIFKNMLKEIEKNN